MIEQKEMMINFTTNNAADVHHGTTVEPNIIWLSTDIVLHHNIGIILTQALPLNYTRSRYDNYKRDSRSYSSPYRSHRSPYRRDSRPTYRLRSYSRDKNFIRYTSSFRPPSRPRD